MTAPAELVITVTADDIAKGSRRECMWCPVAYAARRALGWPGEPSGGLEVITGAAGDAIIISGGPAWLLPESASKFIAAFDKRWPVGPFTFTATLRGAS